MVPAQREDEQRGDEPPLGTRETTLQAPASRSTERITISTLATRELSADQPLLASIQTFVAVSRSAKTAMSAVHSSRPAVD